MNSTLVKFHGKNYYVDYDDLLNKANDKLFAYEDEELTKNATLNGKTLMFNKKDMEDKLKKDIKMPTRMPSNLATEDNMHKINEMRSIGKRNIDKLKKIMHDMWAKNYNVTEDEIIEALPVEWWDTWESADSEIRRLVHDFLNKLKHARSLDEDDMLGLGSSFDQQFKQKVGDKEKWDKKQDNFTLTPDRIKQTELEIEWLQDKIKSGTLKPKQKKEYEYRIRRKELTLAFRGKKGNKMTNEQKLRKYIREMIFEALKEDAPYGEPDEALYLFKTGQDYLAGIQGESLDEEGEQPSAEELAAKQKAAEAKAKKQAYQRFFSQALAKFGYSGVSSIPDEKKKSFFDYIDQNWTSKQEAPQKKVASEEVESSEIKKDGTYMYHPANARDQLVDIYGNKMVSGMEFILKVFVPNKFVELENANEIGDLYTVEPEIFMDEFRSTDDWTDPAGGTHSFDDDDPAKMYETSDQRDLQFKVGDEVKMIKPASAASGYWKTYNDLKNQTGKIIRIIPNSDTNSVEVKWSNGKLHIMKSKSLMPAGIKETSGTGGIAGYETPMAFTGKKGISKKQKSIANQLGYELVDKSYAVKDQGDTQDLKEGLLKEQGSYYDNIIKLLYSYSEKTIPELNEKYIRENYFGDIAEDLVKSDMINEGLDSYYFKDENLTSEQKLGLAMRQVRNSLQEVEKVVTRTIKMKNEENVDSSKVGKRTYSALKRINEKVIRLMIALQDLK